MVLESQEFRRSHGVNPAWRQNGVYESSFRRSPQRDGVLACGCFAGAGGDVPIAKRPPWHPIASARFGLGGKNRSDSRQIVLNRAVLRPTHHGSRLASQAWRGLPALPQPRPEECPGRQTDFVDPLRRSPALRSKMELTEPGGPCMP